MRINILMPLRPHSSIPIEVLDGIFIQSVECALIVRSCGIDNVERANEYANRNWLRQCMSYPYTMFMDDDMVLTDKNNVVSMISFLNDNPGWDAVSLDSKGIDPAHIKHIVTGCTMYRASILDRLIFRQERQGGCSCESVNSDIKLCYLPNTRIKEARYDRTEKNGKWH